MDFWQILTALSMSCSFSVFFSVPMSLDFFTTRSICTLSLDSLFLKPGEFQAWNGLWYRLYLWSQRLSRGAQKRHMEQKSRSIILPRPGFEPQTSHLVAQRTIARPPHTPIQ